MKGLFDKQNIDDGRLRLMLFRILDCEKKNNLTREFKQNEIIDEIIKIIEEELQ